jgi:murein DD-endopeptidase MepM/ murein hydrolase activator NlpD
MIIPMEYTHLGYDFLDATSDGSTHSGVDLNQGSGDDDLGKDIKCMANGQVVLAEDSGVGWGKLIVIHHPDLNIWSRYAHLKDFSVSVGEDVSENQVIGHCGNTGGDWTAHLHWDIIIKELETSWKEYTKNWSVDKTEQYYTNPITFVTNNLTNDMPDPNEENLEPWQTEAKTWAIANEVSTGTRPNDPITRVELWKTLKNYHEKFNNS